MSSLERPQSRYLAAILRPVVRYCLRNAVKLQDILEICKMLLVEEAKTTLERQGLDVSSSRLAVLTGVHRKDVSRLQGHTKVEKRTGDISARVLGRWESDQRFQTRGGAPRVLDFEGADSGFAELVRSVSRELNPYTVLFDLEHAGAVERTPRGLKRVQSTFIARQDLDQSLHFIETDCDDLLSAVEENVFGTTEPPNLHIKTEYDAIPASLVPSIKNWLLEAGDRFHAEAREYLARLEDTPASVSNASPQSFVRVAVGTFSRVEPAKPDTGENP